MSISPGGAAFSGLSHFASSLFGGCNQPAAVFQSAAEIKPTTVIFQPDAEQSAGKFRVLMPDDERDLYAMVAGPLALSFYDFDGLMRIVDYSERRAARFKDELITRLKRGYDGVSQDAKELLQEYAAKVGDTITYAGLWDVFSHNKNAETVLRFAIQNVGTKLLIGGTQVVCTGEILGVGLMSTVLAGYIHARWRRDIPVAVKVHSHGKEDARLLAANLGGYQTEKELAALPAFSTAGIGHIRYYGSATMNVGEGDTKVAAIVTNRAHGFLVKKLSALHPADRPLVAIQAARYIAAAIRLGFECFDIQFMIGRDKNGRPIAQWIDLGASRRGLSPDMPKDKWRREYLRFLNNFGISPPMFDVPLDPEEALL